MTFFIVASIVALLALAVWVHRVVDRDGSDAPRSLQHPPRSHYADQFDRTRTQLR